MLRRLKFALQRAFAPKPPKDLHALFLFNVEQIKGYLTDFLVKSAEYDKQKLKDDEIGLYALFVASQGWLESNMDGMADDLKSLEDRVLAKCGPETSDKMEMDFRRKCFEERRAHYQLLVTHVFDRNPPFERRFSESGNSELVMVFCGHATGFHMAPHTVFGAALEFVRTIDFINACKAQFEQAHSN